MQRPDVASIAAVKVASIFPSPRSAAQIIRHGGLRRLRVFWPSSDRLQGPPSEFAVLKPRFA